MVVQIGSEVVVVVKSTARICRRVCASGTDQEPIPQIDGTGRAITEVPAGGDVYDRTRPHYNQAIWYRHFTTPFLSRRQERKKAVAPTVAGRLCPLLIPWWQRHLLMQQVVYQYQAAKSASDRRQ